MSRRLPRLINKMFAEHIDIMMEVYVDDMLVKNPKTIDMSSF